MSGFGELRIVDGIAMRFLHASHLIIAGRIELVVGDRRHLGLELIQLHSDILVIQDLRRYRIGCIID